MLLDAWLFGGGHNLVKDVFAGGTHVVRDGRHLRRDIAEHAFKQTMKRLFPGN
jgi:formimidoylglutamate deiminase